MAYELHQRMEAAIEQTLELTLAPKLLVALKILNEPYIELVDKIKREVEENPVLEVEQHERLLEFVRSLTERSTRREADYREGPSLENLGAATTLAAHLLDQLHLEELNKKELAIGEFIIESLNARGFIDDYDGLKKEACKKFKVTPKVVDQVLQVVQSFEPEGVGARSTEECLLIQLREFNMQSIKLEKIIAKTIKEHLADLANKEYDKIAASLGIDKSGIAEIENFIKKNLNPNPASLFGAAQSPIIPSFLIEDKGGRYEVTNLEARYGPVLKLNQDYIKVLEDPNADPNTAKYLREKLTAAKDLLGNILKRQQSMQSIAEIITETQVPFLKAGIGVLNPLTQQEIAKRMELHPSTISRAVAGKYVQTPRGLLSLKFLCPRGIHGFSRDAIKAHIAKIITAEEKGKPLSDSQIAAILSAKGVEIARRTVAKYREELGIHEGGKRLNN